MSSHDGGFGSPVPISPGEEQDSCPFGTPQFAEWSPLGFDSCSLIHGFVAQAVGFLVELPPDMLERDMSDLPGESLRVFVERQQTRILDPIHALHLLDQ